MCSTMRHHWLLLGACGWVLLILMFASKFINFRAADNYGEKTDAHSWTEPGAQGARSEAVDEPARPDRPDPKPSRVLPPAAAAPTPSDWQWVTERRMELLAAVCQENATLRNLTHVSISRFVLDRIFVSDKHKILFCQTPKVGNTQWKKVLIVLNGEYSTVEEIPENLVHDHDKNGLPRLSSFSPQDITERLHTYFKFFIVRDPFERLISAFKDKFVKNPRFEPWYKHDIAPSIIRKYRKAKHRDLAAASSSSNHDGGDGPGPGPGLRFEDFVRYLGDAAEGRQRMDRQFGEHVIHWVTYAELCAPCEIRYSVVGHHETLERDAPYILAAAGIEGLVSYPAIPPGITRYNRTKVERYFAGVSRRDARRLYARYRGDFNLFGYPSPDFLLD